MLEQFGSWVFKFFIIIIIAQFVFYLTMEVAMLFFKNYLDLQHPLQRTREWKRKGRIFN